MSLPHFLRRTLNRLLGRGPWRIRSFDAIVAAKRRSVVRPALAPEQFDGVVGRVPPGGFFYPRSRDSLNARFRVGGLVPEPRRELWLLSPGAVAGNTGLVHEPATRTAVHETALDWHRPPSRHPLLAAPGFPGATVFRGLSLSLVTLSAEGFWHFLIESLPKLHLAAPWLGLIDHVLVNGPASPWKQRWLERAGVLPDRIRWIDGLSHFACEQLLFTPPLVADCLPTPWGVATLRDLLQVPPPSGRTPSRRIWAARSDALSRHPVWERQLPALLPGWECVEFSRLTPAEVVAVCADAAVLAGPHGANLANAVFLPPGSHLVEIVPPGPGKPLFQRLAAASSLRFTQLAADFSSPHAANQVASQLTSASGGPR